MTTQDTPRTQSNDGATAKSKGVSPAFDGSGPQTDWVITGVTATIAVALVLWGSLATASLDSTVDAALGWVVTDFGWLFVLAATGFVLFALYLAASRYGTIPLGQDGEKPEFRTVSWIAMMFSAGMGIGLMFYGASEPLTHYVTPPPGSDAADPAGTAMATTLFHWALHPWAMYAVVGLAIAYSTYRKGRRQLVSSAFAPLLGTKRADSAGARVIDILALFATLFGSAASLGLGALQIGAGFDVTGFLDNPGTPLLVGIIAVLTVCFVASAVSGVSKGIQFLSNTNMVLALILAVFVFVIGPTVLILNLVPTAVGSYLSDLPSMSARTAANSPEAEEWLAGWTIFYWAWWVSWTPFVGMFIARISRGRTIRQFVVGVIGIPSTVSLVWFATFGGAAIDQQSNGVDLANAGGVESQLFGLLDQFPLATVMSVLVMVLVAIFFVSGADAASIVMGTLTQRGTQEPQRGIVVFWGVLMGAVAIVMLLLGGSDALSGLQNLTILAAFPFTLVMVALCVSLMKDLKSDPLMQHREPLRQRAEETIDDVNRARSRARGQ